MMDSHDEISAHALVRVFIRTFLMMAIPFALGCAMLGPSIIAALTNREVAEAGRFVCPAIALSCVFYGVSIVAYQVAYVVGKTRTILWANALGAGVNVSLNVTLLALIPSITVPALVAVVSFAVSCFYVVHVLRPHWPWFFEWRRYMMFLLAALAMGAVLYALGFRFAGISMVPASSLATAILGGAAVYFAALHLLGGFGRHEVKQIIAIFRRERLQESA